MVVILRRRHLLDGKLDLNALCFTNDWLIIRCIGLKGAARVPYYGAQVSNLKACKYVFPLFATVYKFWHVAYPTVQARGTTAVLVTRCEFWGEACWKKNDDYILGHRLNCLSSFLGFPRSLNTIVDLHYRFGNSFEMCLVQGPVGAGDKAA